MGNWRNQYDEVCIELVEAKKDDKSKKEEICRKLVKDNFPNKLYKYSYFDDAGYWKKLLLGEVFFQEPNQWNDLFDSVCLFDYEYQISEFKKRILKIN